MKITFYITCIIFVFLKPLIAKASDNDNVRMNQLEQRVSELESIVQLLIKQNKQQATLLSAQQNSVLTTNTTVVTSAQVNDEVTNYSESKDDSVTVKSILDSSDEAEIAIHLYEDLSKEIENNITISGYADVEYRGSSEPGINEEFRMHHLSLFFSKQFDNNVKFFSEIEYEDTPKFEGKNDGSGDLETASGKIFVEALNFDWNYSQHLNIRAGRFFTPAGIWSEDHYPPFVTTQERPLHIRKIFPQLIDGLSLFGSTEFTTNHFFNYTA